MALIERAHVRNLIQDAEQEWIQTQPRRSRGRRDNHLRDLLADVDALEAFDYAKPPGVADLIQRAQLAEEQAAKWCNIAKELLAAAGEFAKLMAKP